jgi:hypothetical protein
VALIDDRRGLAAFFRQSAGRAGVVCISTFLVFPDIVLGPCVCITSVNLFSMIIRNSRIIARSIFKEKIQVILYLVRMLYWFIASFSYPSPVITRLTLLTCLWVHHILGVVSIRDA